MDVRILSSSLVYEGKAVSVKKEEVELPSGKRIYRETVLHRGASAIIPVMDNGDIIFVRQYRHPIGEYILEIPAGTLKEGEDPEACARRELEEETGYRAGELIHLLTIYPSPGYSSERLHLYLARKLEKGNQNLEADEDISITFLSLEDALEAIRRRRIRDAKTIVGILYYSLFVK
ncbi:MAG: NUDIX hydrolase [Thaumarchaeota archaeon]|nr:NUDIX hydrolase [Nitrososphaerota archaeon]